MIPALDIRDALLTLFTEAFEGKAADEDYTWFVEGKEGIFDALETADAEHASMRPSPKVNTLAAHTNHVRFILWLANEYGEGREPEADWEGSWSVQSVDPIAWDALREDVRREYTKARAWLENLEEWSDDAPTALGIMAVLPHVAYHLGAMRQMLRTVSA